MMTQEEFFKRYTYSPSRDRIGGGGFGTVYKAKDNVLHRTVAIKVSEVKTTADGQKTFSLKDEFEALNHVPKHPNIANYEEFYSYEDHRGVCDYAIMQYYPDGNLSNAIKQGLTAEQKEDIATQLLEGIAFLHEHKVVHRDLKPGNILIVRDGDSIIPLITDFGLSKAADLGDGSVFSNSFGGGTQRYSSPEQLQGKPLRLNTDLWSYGAILYEIFTGQQLFSASSGAANTAQADLEIYNKIVNGDVQSLGVMPEKWRKVAERCLVVDADKRAKDEAELFGILNGDAQEDETVANAGGSGGLPPFKGVPEGRGIESPLSPKPNDNPSQPNDEGTEVAGMPQAAGKQPPIAGPSSPNRHRGLPPSKGVPEGRGIESPQSSKPKSKKTLWIALAAAAVAAIAAILFLRQPKQEPVPTDPETDAFLACQTVADYQAFCDYYGQRAAHYAEAQHKIDSLVTDSLQRAEAEAIALAIQDEEASYQACTTIAGCNAYLQAYPQGRYVDKVKQKKAELEDDEAYAACTTVAACEAYLRKYPQGRHVADVRKKRDELAAVVPQNNSQPAVQPQPTPTPEQSLTGTANGHEWVDLGLPSGTLWATCNMGASTPEGYGNYYAWGETSTKSTYDWSTYRYANGDYNRLTKYCNKSDYGNNGFTDNLTTLQGGDDPAASNWGGGWQTPSKAQWDELLANTTHQWTTRNGKSGRLFTSKTNGQTLFLPAAGGRWDSELRYAGSHGIYWSRSRTTGSPDYAWNLLFSSGICDMGNSRRYSGFTVRPVRSAR